MEHKYTSRNILLKMADPTKYFKVLKNRSFVSVIKIKSICCRFLCRVYVLRMYGIIMTEYIY
jgi:hypothetical protein